MEPEAFAEQILDIISEADEKLMKSIAQVQKQVVKRLEELIFSEDKRYKLSLNKDGSIKPTADNLKKLARIKSAIVSEFTPVSYQNAVESYLGAFDELEAFNTQYFTETQNVQVSPAYSELTKSAKAEVNRVLFQHAPRDAFSSAINQVLDSATSAEGASRKQLVDNLRRAIQGDETLGVLESYANRVVRDSLNQFNAAYGQQLASRIKNRTKWYYYSPGRVRDSRSFCIEREGNYYTEQEILSWADLKWQGRHKNTSRSTIFILRGGYNCQHHFILVSESLVPESAKRRARELGWIE